MGDRAPAHIFIGGPVKKSVIPQLLEAIDEEGIRQEHPKNEDLKFETLQDLIDAMDTNGRVRLQDFQAAGAMFEHLETFLQKCKIPFVRYGEGLGGLWDPEVAFYVPGSVVQSCVTNDNGDPIIPASVAIQAYEALTKGNTHAALTALSPYSEGYEVPEIPPFSIIEDE